MGGKKWEIKLYHLSGGLYRTCGSLLAKQQSISFLERVCCINVTFTHSAVCCLFFQFKLSQSCCAFCLYETLHTQYLCSKVKSNCAIIFTDLQKKKRWSRRAEPTPGLGKCGHFSLGEASMPFMTSQSLLVETLSSQNLHKGDFFFFCTVRDFFQQKKTNSYVVGKGKSRQHAAQEQSALARR